MSNSKNIKFNKKMISAGKNKYRKWVVQIILLTFFISAGFSFISDMLLRNVEVLVAFIILILIIMIGIIFDIIGVAVTAANETPFHSMSSRKHVGARTAVLMIRNASKISNLCNDVVGDICGIVSGAAGIVVIAKIVGVNSYYDKVILTIFMSSIIASLTVGGKAIGKHYAITECNRIIYRIGFFLEEFKKIFIIK